MKRSLLVAIIGTMILAISGAAVSAGPRHDDMSKGGHHKGKDGSMRMLEKLDLTESQQAQVDAIMDQRKDEKVALRESVKNAGKSLREAVHADIFDEQAVRSASKTLSSKMEEMAVLRARIFAEVRAILTPEQQEKMKDMHARRAKCEGCREECGNMEND